MERSTTSHAEPGAPGRTAAELLQDACERIAPRLDPAEAHRAAQAGAIVVDLRCGEERRREGVIPGSVHVPRSVLEWRLDPASGYANPHLAGDRPLVLLCAEGFSSALAAAAARYLGRRDATDVVGGFAAWRAAGLPVQAAREPSGPERPGMGGPEPERPAPASR